MDEAFQIILNANVAAMEECRDKGLACAPAYLALFRHASERYIELVESDEEAIRQIRGVLDEIQGK